MFGFCEGGFERAGLGELGGVYGCGLRKLGVEVGDFEFEGLDGGGFRGELYGKVFWCGVGGRGSRDAA